MEIAKFDWKGYKRDIPPTIFATIKTGLRVCRNSLISHGDGTAHEFFEVPYGFGKITFVRNSDVLYPEIKTFKMWKKDLLSIIDVDWWYYGFSIKVDIGFSETDGKSTLVEIPCISFSGDGRMNEVYYEGCFAKIEEDEPPQKQREMFYKMYVIIKTSKEKPKHDFIAPHVLLILADAAIRNEETCPKQMLV